MRIAVDAMGGDYAPLEIVKGAAEGSETSDVDVVLVGDECAIKRCLPPKRASSLRISILHTTETIGMDEHVDAVRTKKDSSLVVGTNLVKNGEADAMISVGNTAAAMAVATLRLGRIPGIERPAIATVMPSRSGSTVLLDAGAVADCTPENLLQFAVMGGIYAEKVLGIDNPRVGLLSIGEERGKGNEMVRAAHELLASSAMNFIGNVEGRDLFAGTADVIVADGFTGNVALKAAEGLAEYVLKLAKEDIRAHPLMWIPLAMLAPAFKRLMKKIDYSEHGGAPLLGLNGVFIVGHGRSKARAVANAVRAAKEAVAGGMVEAIRGAMTSTSVGQTITAAS